MTKDVVEQVSYVGLQLHVRTLTCAGSHAIQTFIVCIFYFFSIAVRSQVQDLEEIQDTRTMRVHSRGNPNHFQVFCLMTFAYLT